MTHIPSCPLCSSKLSVEELGDLVASRCTECGWSEQAMIARVLPEFPRSSPVQISVKAGRVLNAGGMKALRAFAAGAASLSPAELQAQLMNDKVFLVGSFAEHKAREVEAALELAGFTVLSSGQNDA